MVLKTSRKTSRLKPTVIFLAWSAIFAILYAQSPLYLSNQNTYFLHGLAQAGWEIYRPIGWQTLLTPPRSLAGWFS